MRQHDIPMDEFDWSKAERKFEQSIFANALLANGAEYDKFRVRAVPGRVDFVAKNIMNGTDSPIYSILGKAYYTRTDAELKDPKLRQQAERGMSDLFEIDEQYRTMTKHMPAISFIHNKAMDGFHDVRARFDAEAMAKRTATYHPNNAKEADNAFISSLFEYFVWAWDELGSKLTNFDFADIREFEKWVSQLPNDKNGAWVEQLPVNIEDIKDRLWPMYRETIYAMLESTDEVTIDDAFRKPVGRPDANQGIYMLGGRSPDRNIFMTRFFKKLYGGFLNYNVIGGIGGDSFIAWSALYELNEKFQRAMGKGAQVQIANDFKGFDTGFQKFLMIIMRDSFRESGFAESLPTLRRAIDIAFTEMTEESWLQFNSTHGMRLRPGLWSGVDVTQLCGSVLHAAGTRYNDEVLSMGLDWDDGTSFLSDDMISHSNSSVKEMDKIIFGDWTDNWAKMGFTIHPEKTVNADLTKSWKAGVRQGDEVFYTDSVVFLQTHFGPGFTYGNWGRRAKSLYQKERDTWYKGMKETVEPYLRKFSNANNKNRPPDRMFDVIRSFSIIETIGKDFPLIDKIDQWFIHTWPGLEREMRRFATVDPKLWTENLQNWGGTVSSGTTLEGVHGRIQSWYDGTYEPVWD